MKISELIESLEIIKECNGDIDVYSLECDYEKEVNEVTVGWYDNVAVILK